MVSSCDKRLLTYGNFAIKNYSFPRRILFWLVTGLLLMVSPSQAEMCRKLKPSGDAELFQCPRIFEQKTKSWCCGLNTLDSYCCEWSERAKEANLSMGLMQDSFKYAVFFLALIGFVAIFIWLFCYFANKQKLFQHQRQLDSPTGYGHHHHHHPDAPPFAPVPPYSEYSSDDFTGQQNYSDQPPPYDQAISGHYGDGEGNHAATPVSVPLLRSSKVKVDEDDLKSTKITLNSEHTLQASLPPEVPVQSTGLSNVTIVKNAPRNPQPPFNPTYT